MPPIAHRLVADVDTTHDVFDLAQTQRIADVHHHRETDDLGRAVKITKGIVHYHRLREVPFQLNPIFSDNAEIVLGERLALYQERVIQLFLAAVDSIAPPFSQVRSTKSLISFAKRSLLSARKSL